MEKEMRFTLIVFLALIAHDVFANEVLSAVPGFKVGDSSTLAKSSPDCSWELYSSTADDDVVVVMRRPNPLPAEEGDRLDDVREIAMSATKELFPNAGKEPKVHRRQSVELNGRHHRGKNTVMESSQPLYCITLIHDGGRMTNGILFEHRENSFYVQHTSSKPIADKLLWQLILRIVNGEG